MGTKSTEHINEMMNESVSKAETPPAIEEAERLLEVKRNQIYIEDDSFIGNPFSLLGRVLEIRSKDGTCSGNVNDGYAEFSTFPIPGITVDENSKIKQPLITKSFIVDSKLSLEVGFLNFLNSKLDHESLFSVIVFNQAVGLLNVHDSSYLNGMRMWMQENKHICDDPQICHLLVVTGMVQKNIIRKKYKKFDVKAKGGAYGLNVNGSLYTSTEDYSLDIRFGLSYQRIPIANKTDVLKSKMIELGNQKVNVKALNSYLTMKNPLLANLPELTLDIKTDFVEKLFLPTESEISFINKVEYRK